MDAPGGSSSRKGKEKEINLETGGDDEEHVGVDLLRAGATVLDLVEAVVWEPETDPCFNSGRGSALTRAGTVEMEASVMDGRGRRCGAVSGVSTVRNPVSLARRVMDKSPHSYLAFHGAEDFARQQVATSSSHNCL
ncbi:hypothetical protein ZWY2020_007780 [Hordeum vulgare]|nr:hypothetical protein ZWY2020_007780 [Hordeum vulgare]